jgi:diguanylate cyclase (GGDEF)-like protein
VGGDEFCVLAQFADHNARDELLKKFDQEAEARNVKAEHPWERIEVSKGIAVYRPGKDKNAEQVYNRADEAMYKDKRRRKGT